MDRSTPTGTTTVLIHEWVTGGGLAGSPLPASWAAEGTAMRRALARDFAAVPGVRVVLTLDDRFPDEPGPWAPARIAPGQHDDRVLDLATRADYTVLVAPESGGVLAGWARTFEREGVRSLGSAAGAIDLTGDKRRLGVHWIEHGVATPEFLLVRPAEGLPADFPYPAVLKPIDGAGAVNTFWVPHPSSLPRAALGMDEALLQPAVAGAPMSASFLVGDEGRAALIGIGRQRIVQRDQGLHYLGGTLPAPGDADHPTHFYPLPRERVAAQRPGEGGFPPGPAGSGRALTRRLRRHPLPKGEGGNESGGQPGNDGVPHLERALAVVPGLRGFVGLDFLRDEATGRMTMLEINPRPTTSYVGLAALLPAGRLAGAWLAAVAGGSLEDAAALSALVQGRPPLTFQADGTISGGVA